MVNWNVTTLAEYFASQRSFPQKYNTLMATDPAGKLVNAINRASERIRAINEEYAACHSAGVSIYPDITDGLKVEVDALLARRIRMYAGLEQIASALGDSPEPSVVFLQAQAAALKRNHKGEEAARMEAQIAALEKIATDSFQVS